MLTALLIDDEAPSRETLRGKLKLFCPEVTVKGEAASLREAQELLKKQQPDVLFLDIDLGGESGFSLLEQWQAEKQALPAIIFITAHDEFAIKAIKFSALDYLLKPVDPEELVLAVRKLEEQKGLVPEATRYEALKQNIHGGREEKRVVIPTSEGMNVFKLDDMIRLESNSNYTKFILASGRSILSSRTLKEYDQMLTDHGFLRVHKSHLVNINYIARYVQSDGGYLELRNKDCVPISNRKRDYLIKQLRNI